MKVKNLKIREILATNSQKTIEVELETEKGTVRSSVPIGTSRGKYEVNYLPVEKAITKFNIIRRHFRTQEFADQKELDDFLRIIDKSPSFDEIGGNLALAISSAFLKGFALENSQEPFRFLSKKPSIPKPISIVAGGWKGQSDIQEFLLLPVHQKSFLDSISKIANAYHHLGRRLKAFDPAFNYEKNLESAWVTRLKIEETLKILTKIANENLLKIGLDMAASQLYDGNRYYIYPSSNLLLNMTEQVAFVENLTRKYPIVYIEDPFHEDDFVAFSTLTHRLQARLVSGDDLYTTNLERLKSGISSKVTNAIVIKPNQIGTITDTIKVIEEAKRHNMVTVMSHRSGETDDSLICHLAVGLNCDYIKIGISGERIIKINEMIRIEEKLKEQK